MLFLLPTKPPIRCQKILEEEEKNYILNLVFYAVVLKETQLN